MATTKKKTAAVRSTTRKAAKPERDSVYLLKLLMYMLLGTFYIRIVNGDTVIPLPFGLLVGLAFATHEHFQIDRKVELGILVVAAVVGLVSGYGLFIGI